MVSARLRFLRDRLGRWSSQRQVIAEVVGACVPLYLLAAAVGLLPLSAVGMMMAAAAIAAFGMILALRVRHGQRRVAAMAAERDILRLQLHRDPLTGLLNRAAFNAALDALALRDSGAEVVIFFDLDRFKDVNDTYGHKTGDALLIEVARRAGEVLADAVIFARLGGDEFAAIVPFSGEYQAERYGNAIVEAMNQPFDIDGCRIDVAASVGIAVGDPMFDDAEELLRRADIAMYEAKGSPRGGWRLFDEVLDGRQVRESSIRVELGKSMIEKAFALHYQPLCDARTGVHTSVEALLRSQSPRLSDVGTATLIAIAEDSGQIVPLTDWTIETALEATRALSGVPVAVNISPVYFRHPDFVQRLFDKLLFARVRPGLFTVEVTEGVLIADIAAARQSITRLREIGVRVFLDDFGTGYSSLSYLQNFELDGLKLDKSFLRDVGDKRKATQIIRSVIDFGHSLDMRVVVEGVESDWQARLLQLLGCDLLQGYEIGVPMPLDEVIRFIAHPRIMAPGDLPPTLDLTPATLLGNHG